MDVTGKKRQPIRSEGYWRMRARLAEHIATEQIIDMISSSGDVPLPNGVNRMVDELREQYMHWLTEDSENE